MKNSVLLSLILVLTTSQLLQAQSIATPGTTTAEEIKETLTLSLEFRPRTEFRNGYRKLRAEETKPAFFTDQRSRLYLNYQREGFIFHTSIQDIRVWGEDDPRSTEGTLQVFEAYVEPTLAKNLSVRIGRQKIMYDNQRLFAQNDWRQNGGAHDGVRFMYYTPRLQTDLIGAFNQEAGAHERFFATDFSPDFSNYKTLFAYFLKYKATDNITFTAINASDGFQDKANPRENHFRFTSGGRGEYTHKNLYLTLAAYYQYGKKPDGHKVQAYYYQPEASYKLPKHWTFRLGAEVFSGDNGTKNEEVSHSFDALYGVNHRFLGSMDYFTRFPGDLNNAGLIAPYLFIFYDVTKKMTLRADYHLFYSQNKLLVEGQLNEQYLGFENDLLLAYAPNTYTSLNLGFSYSLMTEGMEVVKPGGNSDLLQTWAFFMVTFKPQLFQWTR
jgi:hypothetical protein